MNKLLPIVLLCLIPLKTFADATATTQPKRAGGRPGWEAYVGADNAIHITNATSQAQTYTIVFELRADSCRVMDRFFKQVILQPNESFDFTHVTGFGCTFPYGGAWKSHAQAEVSGEGRQLAFVKKDGEVNIIS